MGSFWAKPWRTTTWNKENEMKYVKHFKPSSDQHVRILLYGPAGGGKSSFINSANSVLQGRMTHDAHADAVEAGGSYTIKYKTHRIKDGRFTLSDTRGLEKQNEVCAQDIKLALKGHVKEGYEFQPSIALSEQDQGYNNNPTPNDKVHMLVCIIPADTISRMEDEIIAKIRDIRLHASNLDIPQIAILTKIDLACPLVGKNVQNVYKSEILEKQVIACSQKVGIPMNCIFPIKNYHKRVDFNDNMDVLILQALRHMLDFGNDFINNNLCN